MAIFDFVTNIFKPVTDLVDDLNLSGEEKLEFKARMQEQVFAVLPLILEHEAKTQATAAANVQAEATGHSWIQRNWRPMIMLMFGYIIAHNYIVAPILVAFGVDEAISLELPPYMWETLKLGLGGYTIGRSAEKIVPMAITMLKTPTKE